MTTVNIDSLDASARQLILSLFQGPEGAVVESEGRTVGLAVPIDEVKNGSGGPWTDEKNNRRCDLIDKKYATGLTRDETVELARLQHEMYAHVRRVAPLPLEEARRLHQELLLLAQSRQPKP